ncbi:MAG: tetratricopeptide repeat protein, partial [Rhodospirillales bacterium]|nr:tetratricopeptide repeat protein [Rhodospirillales bacterium]
MKMLNVSGRIKGFTICVIMALGLSSCGGAMNSDLLQNSFWANGPTGNNTAAELGIAELAKGNYIEAETHFRTALKKNPQDVHALLGLGMLYQNNGLTTRARQMYEALLAIRPDETNQFVVWKNLQTRPISEIASVNLALIESGGVLTSMGRDNEPQGLAEPGMAGMGQSITGAPTPMAMTARAMPSTPD